MRTELPSRCVYDACVLIKFVVPEFETRIIFHLLHDLWRKKDSIIFVPDLFFLECANILWKKVQHGDFQADTATANMDDLLRLKIVTTPLKKLSIRAVQLACELNISAYDAAYVALAEQKSVPLLTADMALARKLIGTQHMVITLDEYLPATQ